MHVQHINMMRWEQQSIDTKHNSKHHKQRENKHKVKQNKIKLSQNKCLLSLGICISLMAFSPYECARGRITPAESVHMSHIEMTIQTCILSPFLSRIDKTIKRNEGKKRRYEQGYDAWGMQDEWENEAQTKKKHDMLRMMEHDVNLGIT